jgi:C4-type Zn-finger protein
MSVVRTFFRHCPSCGRRFEIRLENKKLLKEERVTTMLTQEEAAARADLLMSTPPPLIVGGEVPVVVDVDSFQYTYRCKHCGHEWSEVRKEEHGEGGLPED